MTKCVLLTTDTLHHRFFANFLAERAETTVILETRSFPYRKMYLKELRRRKTPASLVDNPYLHVPNRHFDRAQDAFEREQFFPNRSSEFDDSLSIHQVKNVNHEAGIRLIRAADPDLLVSFGTGVLKERVLATPCLKVNIHRGILPDYRGLDSDLWACYRRDFSNIGTTVHEVERGLDTGAIVGQAFLELKSDMEVYQFRYYTTRLAARLVGELLESGLNVEGRTQDLTHGEYFSFIPPIKRSVAKRRFYEYVRTLARV